MKNKKYWNKSKCQTESQNQQQSVVGTTLVDLTNFNFVGTGLETGLGTSAQEIGISVDVTV